MSSTSTKRPPCHVRALAHSLSPSPSNPSSTTLYCHTCGRITTPRKSHLKALRSPTPPKYCSDKCRREKLPGGGGGIEAEIERAFVDMLGGGDGVDGEGEGRGQTIGGGMTGEEGKRVVLCSSIEARVFKNAGDAALPPAQTTTINSDSEDSNDSEEGGVPLPSSMSPTVPSVAAELTPQQLGRQRATNREKVRQAARRGVAFGFLIQGQGQEERRRRVEAVQGGRVVEASFAKGEWGIRWLE